MASRNYHFKFNTERDKTYIERLDAQDNMQNYIRRLILSDIAADSLRDIIKFAPDQALEEQEPDDEAIEFQRRADLMARYCHGVGDNSDPEYCYSCVWCYHPDNFSDVIKCKFEGLSADEMEKVIKRTGGIE